MEEAHHHHGTEREELETEEGEETPMMREKDLEGTQMRVGKEDGTRDPHPSLNQTTMTLKTMNNLTFSHGSWATPWDNGRVSKGNLQPCLQTRNTKIHVCGY